MHRFLKYGLSKQTNALVSVEEVLRGLKCDCICPECKSLLIARQGDKKQWHFAHANNAECAGAPMTALHLLAQQIIQEERRIMLPPYKGRYYKPSKQLIQFEEVFLEQRIPIYDSYIQPDCIGRITRNGQAHDLLIEILVTHEVDEKKKNDIKALNLACIEIDFSDLIDTDYTSKIIKERLMNKCNDRVWLNNPVFEKREREEQLKEEKRQQELEQQRREEVYQKRNKAFDFVKAFIAGTYPTSTFCDRLAVQPISMQNEILTVLESMFHDSFFEPTDDDIKYAYQQAGLIEYLPDSFLLKDIFDDPYNHYPTLIEYIDSKNDTDGRMFLFRSVLKCVYSQGYHVQYYSWEDRDYYSAEKAIKNKLDSFKDSSDVLTESQRKQLERYVLVYCYDRIQTNIKNNKEHLFQIIENYKHWRVICCLFSLYLHHIIFGKLSNFVQLTEYFLSNHIEYAHLYLKFTKSTTSANLNYTSKDGDDKRTKMSTLMNTSAQNTDLDDIVKFLFPEIYGLDPLKYEYRFLIERLASNRS